MQVGRLVHDLGKRENTLLDQVFTGERCHREGHLLQRLFPAPGGYHDFLDHRIQLRAPCLLARHAWCRSQHKERRAKSRYP